MNRAASSNSPLLWIVAGGFFMQSLDTTIVNTALPALAKSLGETALAMQLVVVAYTLTMATLTPASGWLTDRFGSRRVYLAAVLVFMLGSILCACSTSARQIIAARVVQGIGGAMLLPVGRLTVLRATPSEQYIAALAFISIAAQIGPIFGPVTGGWLVQALNWHWIFLINVPVGIVGIVMILRYFPDDQATDKHRFDIWGCALLSICMVSISIALDFPLPSHRLEWSTLLVFVSIISAVAYYVHAKKAVAPLFDLKLFDNNRFRMGLLGNLICRVGSNATPFLLPLVFQLQLGLSPLLSGLILLPAAISGTLAKRWIPTLVARFGYYKFLSVNTLIVGASIASLSLISRDVPVWVNLIQLLIFGGANSMQFAVMNSITLMGLKGRAAASGNSLFSMVQMLATGLGVAICSTLVRLFSGGGEHTTLAGFRITFLCIGMVTLASILVFRSLRELKSSPVVVPVK